MSNKNPTKNMGLNSNERKKSKDKSSGDLPPTGRSWPFKRGKSKNKSAETSVLNMAVELASSAERKCLVDPEDFCCQSPGIATPPNENSSVKSSDSQEGKGDADEPIPPYQRSKSKEDLTESFSPLTERERILFQDLQEVSEVSES